MGDEADADWQEGLVEWGIEDTKRAYREALERAIRTSPFRRNQTRHGVPFKKQKRRPDLKMR